MPIKLDVTITETKREDGTMFFTATMASAGALYVNSGIGRTRDLALERLKMNISSMLELTRVKSVERLELSFDVD